MAAGHSRDRVVLKGYQTGGFEDIPEDALSILPAATTARWHFRVDFLAVEKAR